MCMCSSKCVRWGGLCLLLIGVVAPAASADLSVAFDGFDAVFETGVSGLTSSYFDYTRSGGVGNYVPDTLFSLGSDRVLYPHGVGSVPSPGGAIGRMFDEGALGVKHVGADLVIQLAGTMDPLAGYYHSYFGVWYGQGDVFLTVADDAGVRQYALLNAWARRWNGSGRRLDGGHYDEAQAFHLGGGINGTDLEGHMVRLNEHEDVVCVGGAGAYAPDYVPQPTGLDYRVFAQGGDDLGDAALVHGTTRDTGLDGMEQDWFVQTWTVPVTWLSTSQTFELGMHATASCGNDQIALVTDVSHTPAPGALLLGALGLGLLPLSRGKRR